MIKFSTNDEVSRHPEEAEKAETCPNSISYFQNEIIEIDNSVAVLREMLNSLAQEPGKKCISNILNYSRTHSLWNKIGRG